MAEVIDLFPKVELDQSVGVIHLRCLGPNLLGLGKRSTPDWLLLSYGLSLLRGRFFLLRAAGLGSDIRTSVFLHPPVLTWE